MLFSPGCNCCDCIIWQDKLNDSVISGNWTQASGGWIEGIDGLSVYLADTNAVIYHGSEVTGNVVLYAWITSLSSATGRPRFIIGYDSLYANYIYGEVRCTSGSAEHTLAIGQVIDDVDTVLCTTDLTWGIEDNEFLLSWESDTGLVRFGTPNGGIGRPSPALEVSHVVGAMPGTYTGFGSGDPAHADHTFHDAIAYDDLAKNLPGCGDYACSACLECPPAEMTVVIAGTYVGGAWCDGLPGTWVLPLVPSITRPARYYKEFIDEYGVEDYYVEMIIAEPRCAPGGWITVTFTNPNSGPSNTVKFTKTHPTTNTTKCSDWVDMDVPISPLSAHCFPIISPTCKVSA